VSKRTYRINPETLELEEITRQSIDWLNTGVRYGRETLDQMKREGLVPPSDFKETWAAKEVERKRLRGELPPTPEMRRDRRQQISDAIDRVRAGYRPPKRDSSWLKD
jgi:hypothetical protein